jgi:hypothetical protein
MEIPDLNAAADARPEEDPWLVTTGLLATELITGQLQLGDTTFEQHEPASIPVAGDLENPQTPSYADLTHLIEANSIPADTTVIQTLDAEGTIGVDTRFTAEGVTAIDVGSPTNHTVASVFWEFMTSSGTVLEFIPEQEGSDYVTDRLFPNPFYATGYPITEPYWTRAVVGGVERDVLLQCFERRCLTYTPDNPDGWKVEFGNIGLHYFHWRYFMIHMEAWDAPATTVAFQAETPQTDGASIVWVDEWDGGVYSAPVGGDPVLVVPGDRQPEYPDIAGNFLVWTEPETPGGDCCTSNIMAMNLTTGELIPIEATEAFTSGPGIDDNWVVWSQFDPDSQFMSVMARDLSTSAPPIVLAQHDVMSTSRPLIDADRVVWAVTLEESGTSGQAHQLWTARIGDEPVLLAETEPERIGDFDLAGDIVVYTIARAVHTDETIHVRNLATGDEYTLPVSGRAVATDGHHVAFQTNSAAYPAEDLVIYDLATGQLQTIADYLAFLPWLDLNDGVLVIQTELGSTLRHGVVAVRLTDLGLD